MFEEKRDEKEQDKIILPKEIQVDMMKFFLRTSIPRKKKLKLEAEKARLSNQNDGSE